MQFLVSDLIAERLGCLFFVNLQELLVSLLDFTPRTCVARTPESFPGTIKAHPKCKRKTERKKIKMKLILVKLNCRTRRHLRASHRPPQLHWSRQRCRESNLSW